MLNEAAPHLERLFAPYATLALALALALTLALVLAQASPPTLIQTLNPTLTRCRSRPKRQHTRATP